MARPTRPAPPAKRSSAAGRMQRALALHREGRLAEAEAIYTDLANRDPTEFEAAYLLAAVLADRGQPAAALPRVEACLALRPADPAALRLHGLLLARLSRRAEALQSVEAALAAQPGFAEAHNDRGTLLQDLGRPEDAVTAFDEAIAHRPGFAEAHNNRGNALAALGRTDAALAAFDVALACNPRLAEAHNNRGNVFKALGRSGAALASYDAALAIRPAYPTAHTNRGNALRDLGRRADALASYDAALRLQPASAEAYHNRAITLADLGRHAEALSACDTALIHAPGSAPIHTTRGMILERLGRMQEALVAFEQAGPDHAEAQGARGLLLVSLGRVPEGCAALEAALAREPQATRFFYNLTQCRRFAADDPLVAPMEALLARGSALPTRDRLDLHFGLGKVFADAGRADLAFPHLAVGNRLQRGLVRYDEAATLAALDRLRTWTAEDMRAEEPSEARGPVPVFILGMPRSGSTLVEQILAGHPEVLAAGEIDDLADVLRGLGDAGRRLLALGEAPPASLREPLRQAGQVYRERLRARGPGARVVTNKTPDNFRLVGLIRLMLPEARIVHTRRHPLDTALSCFATRFTGNQPFTYDLGELGRYYTAYAGVMAHWRGLVAEDAMLDIAYEDVTEALEEQARRLLSFCSLAWTPDCLRFQENRRPVLTASMGQVREPLHRRAVGRWQPYAADLAPLVAELATLLPDDARG